MPSSVAELNIGVGPCWGVTCGDMLEAMARIAPSQPNDAMARIASRRNRTISLDPNLPGQVSEKRFLRHESKLFSKVSIDSKKGWVLKSSKIPPITAQSVTEVHIFTFSLQRFLLDPPCSARLFEVNSEPHTGARPSVRLCVGLKINI